MTAHEFIDDLSIKSQSLEALAELVAAEKAIQEIVFTELGRKHEPKLPERAVKHGTKKDVAKGVIKNIISALNIFQKTPQKAPETVQKAEPRDFIPVITALKSCINRREDLEEESKTSLKAQIEPLHSWAITDELYEQFKALKVGGPEIKLEGDTETANDNFEKTETEAAKKQIVVHDEKTEDISSEESQDEASNMMPASSLTRLLQTKERQTAIEILIHGKSDDGHYRVDQETHTEVLKSIRRKDREAFEISVKGYMQAKPSEQKEGEYKAFLEEMRNIFQ